MQLQVSIAFFSDTVRLRNLKFFLYINPYGYSLQTKFHVPRSHNFREKCNDNFEILQVSIAFFSDTVRPRNLKFFLYINPYGYSLQTKFHVPRSHTFCDDILKLHNVLNNNFKILQVSIAFFSDTVRPRNLKFFLYINPYGYSLQTKFHVPRSHTFREKCNDNLKLASHFSPILCDKNLKFFCILTHMDTLCKPNFMFLGRTLFEKNAMIFQSCTFVLNNNLEILQVSIAFFSGTERPRNLKFFLYINPYGYSLQTKFRVPRSHTFQEKCDDNSKLHNCPNKQLWNFTS